MGRPTEVPGALGTPTTSSNGDHRTAAAASGTLLADVSEPAWGPSTAPPDGAVDAPGDRTGPAPSPEPGPAPDHDPAPMPDTAFWARA
ncbi:hypothetical protein JGS43_27065, partial [Streptomyces sp. P01-F02]|nr:hypothetical protein [Streptomyces poriferorum]